MYISNPCEPAAKLADKADNPLIVKAKKQRTLFSFSPEHQLLH